MRWGGIQKTSLIDYPGKVSCVLFAQGCNFDCPYCHNPELVRGDAPRPDWLDDDGCLSFISGRVGFLDGVVISGGEPTLQPDIAAFCRRVKETGLAVKLDTNGSRPAVIRRLFAENLVDFIAMDVKTAVENYDRLCPTRGAREAVQESIRLIRSSDLPHEFRTTCAKPLVDADVIRSISGMIKGSKVYALQHFRRKEVLHPEYFDSDPTDYTPEDLENFRAIAACSVQRCIVR